MLLGSFLPNAVQMVICSCDAEVAIKKIEEVTYLKKYELLPYPKKGTV